MFKITDVAKWLASRERKMDCDTVVLHATAGSTFGGAFSTLWAKGFSYHAICEDQRNGNDGVIRKCVPYSRVAFHAGKSFGPHGSDVNRYSLGFAFVNLNDGIDPYSVAQFESCRRWIEALKHQFDLKYITTHAIISPGRKTDPKNFQVRELAAQVKLKLWRPE